VKKIILLIVFLFAGNAVAQVNGLVNSKNSKQPVDITSESLTLKPNNNVARFTGNVNVRQGDMTMKADEMLVAYKGQKGAPAANGVNRIDARGNLVLTLPNKKATSELGYYDVAKGKVVLSGDVVMEQGGNTLKGDYFIHDVKTGESTITNKGNNIGTITGAPEKASGGRVRAYLVPKKEGE
jgi:lipopolysaccharide export system protein LptA